jgi:hypothetical protein
MNETTPPKVRRKSIIILTAVLGTVVFAAVLIAAGIHLERARHAALTKQLQGIYVFNRASDGVIYTADLRADSLCYFRVQPPGWDSQPPSFSYSTSRGDISAGVPGPGCENGLPHAWSALKIRGNVVISAGDGANFTLAGRDLVLSDGSLYARVQ